MILEKDILDTDDDYFFDSFINIDGYYVGLELGISYSDKSVVLKCYHSGIPMVYSRYYKSPYYNSCYYL